MTMSRLLTPKDLADILKVKPTTVYQYIFRDVGIPYVKIRGAVRFREESIEKWLREKEKERR